MKKILILLFFVLSIVGCSSKETKSKNIKEETIVLKDNEPGTNREGFSRITQENVIKWWGI